MENFEATETLSEKWSKAVHFWSMWLTMFFISRYLSSESVFLVFVFALGFGIVVSLINLSILVLVEKYLLEHKNENI